MCWWVQGLKKGKENKKIQKIILTVTHVESHTIRMGKDSGLIAFFPKKKDGDENIFSNDVVLLLILG